MGSGFRTTRWTLVNLLQSDDAAAEKALASLSVQYWPAVFAALRNMGFSEAQSSDLAQSFFHTVILERRLFVHADRTRGRLRTLIRTALRNFVTDERRRQGRQQVAAEAARKDAARTASREASGPDRADVAFDQAWAVEVLNEALRRCRAHFEERNKQRHWQAFEACILQPAVSGNAAPSLTEVARTLGFNSAAHVAASNQTVRHRMRLLLHECAAETTIGEEEREAEYAELLTILGG